MSIESYFHVGYAKNCILIQPVPSRTMNFQITSLDFCDIAHVKVGLIAHQKIRANYDIKFPDIRIQDTGCPGWSGKKWNNNTGISRHQMYFLS